MERLLEGGVWDGPGVAKDGDWEGAGGNHIPEPEIQGERLNTGFLKHKGINSFACIAGHILNNIASYSSDWMKGAFKTISNPRCKWLIRVLNS